MKFVHHRAKLRFMTFKSLIDADSLQDLLGKPHLAVVDCRFDLMKPEAGRQAYLTAHIPGARYADLNRDLSAPTGPHTGRHPLPSPDAFARRLSHLGIGNDTQVVAYDDANGSIAARLWWMLRWLGHRAVAAAELEHAFRDPKTMLVDARAQERYAGTVEPIDAVAGHIPGAVNHPFTANLGADGRFLSAAELKRRWQERLAGRDLTNLVAMCG